jgi:16S rRNA processing protein RimM
MELNEMVSVGRITKLHGVKGAVVLRGTEELHTLLKGHAVFFLGFDGYPVPFFPESVELLSNDAAIVHFRDIGSPVKAEELPGREVYLPRSKTRRKKKMSFRDLEGYTLIDKSSGMVGIVTGVLDFKMNPLLEVSQEGKNFLVPFTEPVIQEIQHKEKIILADLPEGLTHVNE